MSLWFKPRQVVIMDAQSSGPARNFRVRYFTLMVLFLLLTLLPFALGSWYAPFHEVQQIIPENIKLKRQNLALQRKVADVATLNDLKDEQMSSLKEQIALQESEIVNVTKQLHMYKSILDERKGKGIHILEDKVIWESENKLAWQALFVKGGSYPRYLSGKFQLIAKDDKGHEKSLNAVGEKYKIESHVFLKKSFGWQESWIPNKVELVVFNSRRKEVLRKVLPIK